MMWIAWSSLTLSSHLSLSSIVPCWLDSTIYELILTSPAVFLKWMVCEMGGKWLYSYCFVGCFFQDLFKTFLHSSQFFPIHFISIQLVHLYNSTATAWKKSCFILSERSDFSMINNLSIAAHTFAKFSIYDIAARYVNRSTNFRGLPHNVEIIPLCLKDINSVLFACMLKPIPSTVCSMLCSRDSTWAGLFEKLYIMCKLQIQIIKMVLKQIYLTHRSDPNNYYHFWS